MARQAVANSAVDIKQQEGVEFSGNYTGHKEIDTKLGVQTIWNFTDSAGKPFGVYGFTMLNRAMESVGEGEFVYITYTGKKKLQTKYGLKDVHQVSVDREVPEEAGA